MWAIKDSGVYFALVTGDSDMENGPKMRYNIVAPDREIFKREG